MDESAVDRHYSQGPSRGNEREFWLEIRRHCNAIVAAIDRRYGFNHARQQEGNEVKITSSTSSTR